MTPAELLAAAITERRQQVIELTQQGFSLHEIAAQLEVNYRTVCRDRVATGIAKQPNRPWTAAEQARAVALIADGASLTEVAHTLGRSTSTVGARFKGLGWTNRQTGNYNRMQALRRALNV